MTELKELLSQHARRELDFDQVVDALADKQFSCCDSRLYMAVQRLGQFYRSESRLALKKHKNVFQDLMDELLLMQDLEVVRPVTVMCKEPDGELGELYLYELAPKTIDMQNESADWNQTVVTFMWRITVRQAYGLFLFSHAPDSRIPPHSQKQISNITPAQIEAKGRAVRFLLHGAFVNAPERLAKLTQQLGDSPWKHITRKTQMFGVRQGTIGYVLATLQTKNSGFKLLSLERKIAPLTEIGWPALARAVLYLDQVHEVILVLQNKNFASDVSVFIVNKTLMTIFENGDVFYNTVPSFRK